MTDTTKDTTNDLVSRTIALLYHASHLLKPQRRRDCALRLMRRLISE